MMTSSNSSAASQARRAFCRYVSELAKSVINTNKTCCSDGKKLYRIVGSGGTPNVFIDALKNRLNQIWEAEPSPELLVRIIELEAILDKPEHTLPLVRPSVAGEFYMDALMGRQTKVDAIEKELHRTKKCICYQ